MEYQPMTAVWEVTMGCNMRCGHCGSSCEAPLPDELSTEEALDLADQVAMLGLQWITLSGGEPTTRKDLPQIVACLHERGVSVNIITNGWLMDAPLVEKLKASGIATIAISIDGTETVHDSIRREGSYKRAEKAFQVIKDAGILTGAVTTVSKMNLPILAELRDELIRMGVESWQLQIGLPMGNFKERPEWVMEPEDVTGLIDFCYETALQGKIRVYPADCIGYFTEKEQEIRRIAYRKGMTPTWNGCNAGVRGFGILHNGDILGCTSIRDREYIEGSIREKKLREIWEALGGFAWRRKMTKGDLGGECGTCTYGSRCLGGCPNTRLTMNGTIKSENQYCQYNVALKRFKAKLNGETGAAVLLARAKRKLREDAFQETAILSDRVLSLEPDNIEALDMKGFAEYMCGNYGLCKAAHEQALLIKPGHAYALEGLDTVRQRVGM
jgi:radical SAM protein with 4Fe4S-binding SPASM domain